MKAASLWLLAEIGSAGYDAYMLDEEVGVRADGRNLLCVPRSRVGALRGSFALRLAAATGRLFFVDASSVAQHAMPCCAHGGPCCRNPLQRHNCCRDEAVTHWRRRAAARLVELNGERQRARGPQRPPAEPVAAYGDQAKLTWPSADAARASNSKPATPSPTATPTVGGAISP
jgi:hypothetical protein